MGAYQDEIFSANPTTMVIHLPLSETIPGTVTDLGNTGIDFTNAHVGVTGSHNTIVQGETACARYDLLGNTHGEIVSTTNLRSVRIWFRAESSTDEIVSFGRSDDIYQDIRIYMEGGVIKVDIDSTTVSGTTTVLPGVKTFLYIQMINGKFYVYVNGAPDNTHDIFYSGIDFSYEFDWYRVSSAGLTDTLTDESGNPLLDEFGNYLVAAAVVSNLTDASGNTLTDQLSNTLY